MTRMMPSQMEILTNRTIRRALKKTAINALRGACRKWAPPPRMSIIEWAEKYRWLAPEESARPGKYRFNVTPHLTWPGGPLEALDDPAVTEIVGRKSAQVAWTSGVLGNALGKWIDIDPSPILVLFPKAEAAKQYVGEKLEPMIEATPRLRKKVDLRSRKLQQRQDFKRFPGGFLKMVGSNSPASVKSTPVPRVAIEEPDDCNLNLRGQGDSIKLAKERLKTFRRSKIIIGGTPTIKGLSAIDAELELSDKRIGLVTCHECGQEHALSFDNLHCDEDPEYHHEVYGKKRPEKAFYSCPHCGAIWDDNQKNANLKHGRWQATAEFRGIAGYILNELYATFWGSRFQALMEKKLQAEHAAAQGNIGPMIAFVNSSKGESYEYQSDAPKTDELEKRAEPYAELTAPRGVLLVTVGVDVQGDRLALIITGWGRGEESWRLYWGSYTATQSTPTTASGRNWIGSLLNQSLPRAARTWRCRRSASTARTVIPAMRFIAMSVIGSASTSWRSRALRLTAAIRKFSPSHRSLWTPRRTTPKRRNMACGCTSLARIRPRR